jgi:hypothetical protein
MYAFDSYFLLPLAFYILLDFWNNYYKIQDMISTLLGIKIILFIYKLVLEINELTT